MMKENKKVYWNSVTNSFFEWFIFALLLLNCSIFLQILILFIIIFYDVELIINKKAQKDKS